MSLKNKPVKEPMEVSELLALIEAALQDLDDRIADTDLEENCLNIRLHNGTEFTISSANIKTGKVRV